MVSVLMVVVPCPAVKEDCKRLFEEISGSTVYPLHHSKISTCIKVSQSSTEFGLRMHGESCKLYKNSAIEGKVFQKICEDMAAEYTFLFYYCPSQWLSRGNLLSHTHKLRQDAIKTGRSPQGLNGAHWLRSESVPKIVIVNIFCSRKDQFHVEYSGSNCGHAHPFLAKHIEKVETRNITQLTIADKARVIEKFEAATVTARLLFSCILHSR
ncbi:unnamed protein product [Timema podura]|uniref:Uncharacterized protein n=1 Tax=Timema podura TaxID=61482 RepID=A0ABN7NSY3_TIMPD|nr:unnamed protein product [Timema podura]